MNGKPLPIDHGFPVRTVVPGLYGYVSACKWVVDIEVTRFDEIAAYWTERGWARAGPGQAVLAHRRPGSGAEVAAGDGPDRRRGLGAAHRHRGRRGRARRRRLAAGRARRRAHRRHVGAVDGHVDARRGRPPVRVRATDKDGSCRPASSATCSPTAPPAGTPSTSPRPRPEPTPARARQGPARPAAAADVPACPVGRGGKSPVRRRQRYGRDGSDGAGGAPGLRTAAAPRAARIADPPDPGGISHMKLDRGTSVPVLAVGASVAGRGTRLGPHADHQRRCGGCTSNATAYDATLPDRWSVSHRRRDRERHVRRLLEQPSRSRRTARPCRGRRSSRRRRRLPRPGRGHGRTGGAPVDACTDLPGVARPAGTACTPPPDVQRVQGRRSRAVTSPSATSPRRRGADLRRGVHRHLRLQRADQHLRPGHRRTPTIEHVDFTPHPARSSSSWLHRQAGAAAGPGHRRRALPPRLRRRRAGHHDDQDGDGVRRRRRDQHVGARHPVKHVTKDEQPVKPGVAAPPTDDRVTTAPTTATRSAATCVPARRFRPRRSRPRPTTAVPTAVDAGTSRPLDAASAVPEGDRSPTRCCSWRRRADVAGGAAPAPREPRVAANPAGLPGHRGGPAAPLPSPSHTIRRCEAPAGPPLELRR